MITGSLANSFSIIGAISTFIIIYYSILIVSFKDKLSSNYFLMALILANPMIWIMSNRYMPDLMGLSLFVVSFYMLVCQDEKKYMYIGGVISGLLLGVRLSYFPLLILPMIKVLRENKKNTLQLISSIALGVVIWLIPIVYITGLDNLIYVAQNQSLGHFTDFGGTMITESDWSYRIKLFLHTIWSDGLGGYWFGRSFITILLSISMIPILFSSISYFKSNPLDSKIKILIGCIALYVMWILFFQNIVYKSRHVLPVVYFIIVLLSYGYNYLNTNKYNKIISTIFIVCSIYIGSIIAFQHKQPTAISKVKDYLIESREPLTIITTPLISYYLKSSGVNFTYYDAHKIDPTIHNYGDNNKILMIGDFQEVLNNKISVTRDTSFYHNPYVNRMWSTINLYLLENDSR